MAVVIGNGVGKPPRAANNAADVRAIQAALIERADGDIGVTVTGRMDPPTIAAIVGYQKQVLKLPFPDGVVLPGGTTHNFLNDPRKRFSAAVRQGTTVVAQPDAVAIVDDPVRAAYVETLTNSGFNAQVDEFDRWYRNVGEDWAKGSAGFLGRADDGRRIAQVVMFCRGIRWNPVESKSYIKGLLRFKDTDLDKILEVFTPAGRFGKVVGGLGSAAAKFGYVTLALDVILYGRQGNWGAAAGEMYKFGMNKVFPWAAMIEGIGSLCDNVLPDSVKTNKFFRFLRMMDPVGLGGAGFDAIYSLVNFFMNADNPAVADKILDGAVARLQKGPTAWLKIPADYAADTIFNWLNPNVYKGG